MMHGISETRLMAGGGLSAVEARVQQIESMVRAIDARRAAVDNATLPAIPVELRGTPGRAALATPSSDANQPKPFQFYLGQAASAQASPSPASSLSERATQFQPLIAQASAKYGVDAALLNAVICQESGFNPQAVSKAGAQGLMQLMPGTARELGVSDPSDPAQNVDGGARYLKRMLEQFNGNIPLALAAYNAGPGAVTRHKGIPPYEETQNYVRTILSQFLKSKQGQSPA